MAQREGRLFLSIATYLDVTIPKDIQRFRAVSGSYRVNNR
jgi:hypothetical protein